MPSAPSGRGFGSKVLRSERVHVMTWLVRLMVISITIILIIIIVIIIIIIIISKNREERSSTCSTLVARLLHS